LGAWVRRAAGWISAGCHGSQIFTQSRLCPVKT
jgi:hypothetical protein